MTHDRKGWAIPSALAQCELEGFGWTWSSSGVSDCAFPISLNVFGIVVVVLDSLKPRHHGKVPYPRRGSEFSSVENANQFCDFLHTVVDKHAPPSLQNVITHNSYLWFESIRDELFIAKRERHQAKRKWMNTKLTIFKDLYGKAKHKVSKLVHTAKCKFYTEGIALASSSKELHQIVNTLSNRDPPKILPTIYPSADLPSIFIKHFTNKVD